MLGLQRRLPLPAVRQRLQQLLPADHQVCDGPLELPQALLHVPGLAASGLRGLRALLLQPLGHLPLQAGRLRLLAEDLRLQSAVPQLLPLPPLLRGHGTVFLEGGPGIRGIVGVQRSLVLALQQGLHLQVVVPPHALQQLQVAALELQQPPLPALLQLLQLPVQLPLSGCCPLTQSHSEAFMLAICSGLLASGGLFVLASTPLQLLSEVVALRSQRCSHGVLAFLPQELTLLLKPSGTGIAGFPLRCAALQVHVGHVILVQQTQPLHLRLQGLGDLLLVLRSLL
mmetsp:Transcript_26198/g.37495  ORF Transcript_26198/g.37495 Transcript_26198/m.37495 type:complete len:284 (-) Transcript_26198:2013-2864(-)